MLTAIYVTSSSITLPGQEQNVIFGVQTLLNGGDLYRDPQALPFVATQYTPFFHQLCFLICKLLGLGADDTRRIYIVGRLISAASIMGCGLVILRILSRHAALDITTRIGIAFLPPLILGSRGFAARPDALYLFFIMVAFSAALTYAAGLTRRSLLICVAALLAAFYTKQTALFMFPLPFVVGFARHGWRVAWRVDLLICLAMFGAGMLCMSPAMIANFAVGLGNGIDLSYAFRNVYAPVVDHHWPLLLAAAVVGFAIARRSDWAPRAAGLATLWFLVCGVVLSIKWGSAENYLFESLLGCLVVIGMAPVPHDQRRGWMPLFGLGLLLVTQFHAAYFNRPEIWSALRPRPQVYDDGRRLRDDTALQGKPILVLDFASLVFIPDRAVFAPFEVMGTSAARHHFDLSLLMRAVRDGDVCFAVSDDVMLASLRMDPRGTTDWNSWMPEVGRVVLAEFHETRRIGSFVLLTSNLCDPGRR